MRVFLFCFVIFSLSSMAAETRFELRDVGQRNLVYFVSEGVLQKTVGITHSVSGWASLDLEKPVETLSGQIDIDVRSMGTGLVPFDFDLRKWIGSNEEPIAKIDSLKVLSSSNGSLIGGNPINLRVSGNLKLHGTSRPTTFLVKLVYIKSAPKNKTESRLPGNLLKISASGELNLESFGVQVPGDRRGQVAPFAQVFMDAIGTDAAPVVLSTAPVSSPITPEKPAP